MKKASQVHIPKWSGHLRQDQRSPCQGNSHFLSGQTHARGKAIGPVFPSLCTMPFGLIKHDVTSVRVPAPLFSTQSVLD